MNRLSQSLALALALSGVPLSAAVASPAPGAAAAPVVVPSDQIWSGCEVGGHVGRDAQRDENRELFYGKPSEYAPAGPARARGLTLGALLGCAWQSGRRVLGYELDGAYTRLSSHAEFVQPLAAGQTLHDAYDVRTPFETSVRARAGVAMGRSLSFATAGLAIAKLNYTYFQNDLDALLPYELVARKRLGVVVGAGLDRAVSDRWRLKAEYRFTDFGTVTNLPTIYSPGFTQPHRTSEQLLRFALSYKFGDQ